MLGKVNLLIIILKMRKIILFLALAVALSTAFKLDYEQARRDYKSNYAAAVPERAVRAEDEEYKWSLDVFRIFIEFALTLVLSPLFIITSVFLNNQEIYRIVLYQFLYLPVVRLSGWEN
jgi:hypothetical protein